jgi:hypothetical protein
VSFRFRTVALLMAALVSELGVVEAGVCETARDVPDW